MSFDVDMDEFVELQKENRSLREQFESVLSLAEHLFQMIPREVWRDQGGDDQQGHYEGDYYAEQTEQKLRAWRGSNPASAPAPTVDSDGTAGAEDSSSASVPGADEPLPSANGPSAQKQDRDPASTLSDRNPASVVGVPWNEQGYAGDADPASESERAEQPFGESPGAAMVDSTATLASTPSGPRSESPVQSPASERQ